MTVEEQFLKWAERDRGRSPHTLTRYRAALASLATVAPPSAATVDDVEAWWATRYEAAPATRANELACLRTFYRWATRFGHRDDDPTRRLDPPTVDNTLPRMVGREDFATLLGELTDTRPHLKRAIALGGYAGLRIHEVAELDWSMIDEDQRVMFIRGKGRKERPVPVSPLLLDYLLPNTGGNVVAGGGEPFSVDTLGRAVNRLIKSVSPDRSFHDLRKRAASLALSKGASPAAVRTFFGWSSMETVAAYAVVGDSELARVAELIT